MASQIGSGLTTLRGPVNRESDLRYVRLVAIASTETTEYLDREGIAHQIFTDAEAGLLALQKDRIDALLYDRPLLLWLVKKRFFDSLRVLRRSPGNWGQRLQSDVMEEGLPGASEASAARHRAERRRLAVKGFERGLGKLEEKLPVGCW